VWQVTRFAIPAASAASRTARCTTDSCSPSTGCTTTPIPGCGACTSASQCKDGNPCTSNLCTNGRCQFVPFADGSACSDGNACTTSDRCSAGRCVGAETTTCPVPGACAVGRCDAALGCVSDRVPDGTPCDDGNACTRNDACSAGVCGAVPSTASLMTVERFAARSIGATEQRLRGRATLPGGAALELDRAGMTLEIEDASGTPLYGVDLPGSAFLPQSRAAGSRASIRPGADPTIRRLALRTRGEDASLRFTIVGKGLLPPGSNAVTLKVRPPKGCSRTKSLACTTGHTGVTCAAPEESIVRDREPAPDEDASVGRRGGLDDDRLNDTGERRRR